MGRGTRIVKSVAFTLLASLSFAYLALCAYGISKTGSTAGLAGGDSLIRDQCDGLIRDPPGLRRGVVTA